MAIPCGWMRSKIFRILFVLASYSAIKILLQTDNMLQSNQSADSNSQGQQSIYNIRDWINDNVMNVKEQLVVENNHSNNKGNQSLNQMANERTPLVNSRHSKKEGIRTHNISYDTFLNQKSTSEIINILPEKHPNVGFLKNMPTDEEMKQRGAIQRLAHFGDPNEMGCYNNHCYINGRTLKREIIIENPKDTFTSLPPEGGFLKEFKNPCWKAPNAFKREALFCVPYFFIIGFTKCGTTDLHAILNSHILITPRFVKETHYFDRVRRGRSYRMHRYPDKLKNEDVPPRSFMSYVNGGHYRGNLMKTYQEVEGTDVLYHGITMDATPSHVWDNEYWEVFHPGHKEPPVTNADTIANIYPKTKIIFSLRDPVSRMRSAYQFFCSIRGPYNCDRPITPEKYHNLVVEAVEKFNSCLKNNTVRGCTYSTDTHQLATHLYASIYHVYIADFMKVFPRNQLYFLKMEEHVSDLSTSTNDLCDFLEVPQFPEEKLHQFQERKGGKNTLKDNKRLPYVLPETTEILEEFFKPYLRDLVHLLGDEKWYWDRPH